MSTSLNIYVYPSGPQRIMQTIIAPSLAAARKAHPESTLATREQISGLLVAAVMISVVSYSGKNKGYAEPEQFGLARKAYERNLPTL